MQLFELKIKKFFLNIMGYYLIIDRRYHTVMDSQVQVEGRLLDVITDDWRKDKLPLDEIIVPSTDLPDPDADNGQTDSLRQQENKWTDLALSSIQDIQTSS